MMDISHLYHDATFGDPTLELDVKEQLKTREVNAREERNLQRMHRSYDREMGICEKNTAWERWKVGKSLQGIWERSPRLEKRLALEKARIEAMERSILYRNYRMNTDISALSMAPRSFTKVNLKSQQDNRRTQQSRLNPRKKDSKYTNDYDEDSDQNPNSNGNGERNLGRQADFVRRSEHSIKALAKLNWKQQSRRRDHERFKEDLFFHSKHVFDKAKVVLKGRPDVNVENMYTDLESILLPPVKKSPSVNITDHNNHNNYNNYNNHNTHNSSKTSLKNNSNSNLYEKNVLRLGESPERKQPPYLSRLPPVSEQSETKSKDEEKTNNMSSTQCLQNLTKQNGVSTHSETSPSSVGDTSQTSLPPQDNSSTSKTSDESELNDRMATDPYALPVQSTNTISNSDSSDSNTQDSGPHISLSTTQKLNRDATRETSTDSNAETPSNLNDTTPPSQQQPQQQHHHHQQQEQQQQQPSQQEVEHQSTTLPPHPFSPSTSISHVIIEENEEGLGEGEEVGKSTTKLNEIGIFPDINNNTITNRNSFHDEGEFVPSSKDSANGADSRIGNSYTMTCTTGLPQLWKQTSKPKEKAPPEVSASAIARKHKRKRRDRW